MTDESKKPSRLKNILAIVAFLILLGVGIWSAIQVISFIPHIFSSDGTATLKTKAHRLPFGKKDIVVSVTPQNAKSGNPVLVQWNRKGGDAGVTSFAYACKEGFHFEINNAAIPCNIPYTFAPDQNTLQVTPITTKASIEVPFAITYTNENGDSIRDSKTLTVINTGEATSITHHPTQPTPTSYTHSAPTKHKVPAQTTTHKPKEAPSVTTPIPTKIQTKIIRVPRQSNPYGVADLSLISLQVGTVASDNSFMPQPIISRYEKGAAQFIVKNNGTKETGTWYFSATVPSNGNYTFTSRPQPSLLPGASATLLITFDQLQAGLHNVSIQLDPYNYTPESNEYNNVFSKQIHILSF